MAQSAGLVEVSESKPNVRPKINFIHRSAKDFLKETVQGQVILKYDSSTPADRTLSLMEAYLAMAAFFDPKGYVSETAPCGNESLFSGISQLSWGMRYEQNPVSLFVSGASSINETSMELKYGVNFTCFIHQLRRISQESRWFSQALSALQTTFLGVMAQWAPTP